jgi:hypothetical protein
MIYRVVARFKTDTAAELRRRLDDGSIAAQQPDGQELVDSLHRAVISESGDVQWSERCYCASPLAHERATILDHYFNDIVTQTIEDHQEYEGRPFLEYLEAQPSS